MKKKKHSILTYLVKREYGQHLRGDGRNLAHLIVEDKAADPAVNKPCALSGQARSTFVMVFSPDGTKVASTHGDHTVRVTDIASGKCLHSLKGHPRTPWSVAFHPSSSDILASGCLGGDVRIWDLKGGGSEVWKVPNNAVIASLTFHPSDHLLVIASANTVYFWDWNLPEPLVSRSTRNEYEQIRWVKFDPLGQHLFTGIANGSTVQRDDSIHHASQFGYMNDGPSPYMDPHRAGLRRQYYDLVSRYNQHQRDDFGFGSINTSAGRTGTTPSGSSYSQSMSQSSPLDIDLLQPTSPTRVTALDDARQYASIVTNLSNTSNSSLLRSPRDYNMPRSLASFSSETLNSSSTDGSNTASSSSSQPLYRGRWRYVSREPGAANRLTGFLRNNSPPSGTSTSATCLNSPQDGPSEAYSSSRYLRESLQRYRNREKAKKEDQTAKKSKSSSGSSAVSGEPEASSSRSGEHVSAQDTKLDIDKLSDTSQTTRFQTSSLLSRRSAREAETSNPASTSGSRSQIGELRNSVPKEGPSDERPPQTRPRCSLLRSWLKSTKRQTPSGASNVDNYSETSQNTSRSDNNSTPDPERNTARSVTVIRPSIVDLPRILDSQPSASHGGTMGELESRATARVMGSGSMGTGPLHCERCLASRNLVLRESLPNPFTPPQPTFGPPSGSSQSDVGCETEDNTNSSLHRSIGTETNKGASHKNSNRKACNKHSKVTPFALFSKRRLDLSNDEAPSSSSRQITFKSENDSDEPPRKRLKSDPSDSSDHKDAISTDANKESDSKTIAESCSKGDVPGTSKSSTGADVSSDRPYKVMPSTSRASCSRDAAYSSSSDHIKTELNTETEPAANFHNFDSRARPASSITGCQSTPSNSMNNVYRPSTSQSRNVTCSHPSSRDGETLACTLPNCTNVRGVAHTPDTSNPANRSNRVHSNLSRRYHRLQDFRRRILDIHDLLQQRRRTRSVQDRLRSQRAPRSASFANRIESLRQERLRAERYVQQRFEHGSLPPGPYVIPDITITRPPDSPPVAEQEPDDDLDDRQEILRDLENMRMEAMRVRHQDRVWRHQQSTLPGRTWHQLQRRYLHPHYAVGILDETINQPNDSIQSAINRAIAGVYLGSETAVASNIVDKTYRIQRWYFDVLDIPYIDKADENIVVPHCKLHNDTSAEISQDGHLLATFVPSQRGFPDDTILAVYSLEPDTLGQCWFTKGFGPNAISVSISPLNQYVLVGLAARRLAWVFSQAQQVAQVYSLCNKEEGELSMKHVTDIMHPCDSETRTHHISVNSAKWLPRPGEGIMYGTNRGDLHICRPGKKGPYTSRGEDSSAGVSASSSSSIHNMPSQNLRRNLMEMLGITVPRTISTATQTPPGPQRTTSTTQTLVIVSSDSSSDSD